MSKEEIALQLTLKAIDKDAFNFRSSNLNNPSDKILEEVQKSNAKQVYEFYNAILENIKPKESN